MDRVETVRIKTQPCKGNPDGIVIINAADYDPSKHELVDISPLAGSPPKTAASATPEAVRRGRQNRGESLS